MKFFKHITIGFVITFFLFTIIAIAETNLYLGKRHGQSTKEIVEKRIHLPSLKSDTVRDLSEDNLKPVLNIMGYKLIHSSTNLFFDAPNLVIKSLVWNRPTGGYKEQITALVIIGMKNADDGFEGLFEAMGRVTNMPLTPETFSKVENGPGDICFGFSSDCARSMKNGANSSMQHRLWFIRDNIGIELFCSGDTDLLPAAKAIDKAIQSCPKKQK